MVAGEPCAAVLSQNAPHMFFLVAPIETRPLHGLGDSLAWRCAAVNSLSRDLGL